MTTVSITLDAALDRAVEQLPFVRRRVLQARLRNPNYRENFTNELILKLYDDRECCEMGIQPIIAGASGTTVFTFDPENLGKFFELIIKYLPQLLAIILPLFTSILLPFMALVTAMSCECRVASCEEPQRICINGVCYDLAPQQVATQPAPVMPVVNAVAHATANVARATVATVTYPLAARNSQLATYYPNHWSHPGDIASHLTTSHGVNVYGMSKEEMLAYHDSLHSRFAHSNSGLLRNVIVRRPLARLFGR